MDATIKVLTKEQAEAKGFLACAVNTVLAPDELFRTIDAHPRWFLPVLAVAVAGALSAFLFMRSELGGDLVYEQIRTAAPQLTEAQLDKAATYGQAFGAIGAAIMAPVLPLLVAGLIYLTIVIGMGGGTSFSKLLSLAAHVQLLTIPQTLFVYFLIFKSERLEVSTSLAMFFPALKATTFWAKFLGWFELFRLWQLALLGWGTAHLCRWKPSSTVGALGALYAAVAAAAAYLGAAAASGVK